MKIKASNIKSLDKGLKLLVDISNYETGTTITALDRKFRFGKSTIHRLLTTFKASDFIRHDIGNGRYMLGYKIFEMSHKFEQNTFLVMAGKRYLKDITRITQETTNLGVLDGRDVIYLAKEESFQQLRTSAPVGSRVPAPCTALGKSLLSDLSDKELDELYPSSKNLPKMTVRSIVNIRFLKRELQKIREEGISYDNEETVMGIRCIGVPIKNFTGKVVAAISISLPAQRADSNLIFKYSNPLKNKGEKLSRELGYKPNK